MYIYLCVAKHSRQHITGWRRLIGSPKLQIIFHERATKYRALLRNMTYKDKGSYESWPPCTKKARYAIYKDVSHENERAMPSRLKLKRMAKKEKWSSFTTRLQIRILFYVSSRFVSRLIDVFATYTSSLKGIARSFPCETSLYIAYLAFLVQGGQDS